MIHGLSIPLGKFGFYLPRTFSTAISVDRDSAASSGITTGPRLAGVQRDSGIIRVLPPSLLRRIRPDSGNTTNTSLPQHVNGLDRNNIDESPSQPSSTPVGESDPWRAPGDADSPRHPELEAI